MVTQKQDPYSPHQLELVLVELLSIHKKKRKTLVTKALMRKSMDLLLMINQFFHNHGEELRKLTQPKVF